MKLLRSDTFHKVAAAVLLSVSFYVFVIDAAGRELVDFSVYIEAARRLFRYENMYQFTYFVPDRWGREIDSFYFYPPFFAFALGTTLLPLGDPYLIKLSWCAFSYGCLVGSAYILSQLATSGWWARLGPRARFTLTFFFIVCFEPVYWGTSDGQVTSLVLLLLSGFLLALQRRREVLAGLILGLAVLVKMSPALLLLGVLIFRRRKVVLASLLGMGALSSIVLVVLGDASAYLDFYRSLTGLVQDSSRREFMFNYVFDKALLAPFGLADGTEARFLVKAILLVAATLLLLRLHARREKELRAQALLVCFMIVCSPILWFHHLAWALIPLFVLSLRETANQMQHLTHCLGLYFALSQVNLIHYWTWKEFPALLPLSTLLPGVLLLILAAMLSFRDDSADTSSAQPTHIDPA